MNTLIIGLNKIGINYINYYALEGGIRYHCIDTVDLNNYIDLTSSNCRNITFHKKEITISNVEDIFKEYKIDSVINCYELPDKLNHTKEEYNECNYKFVVSLVDLCIKYNVEHLTHLSTILVYGNNYSYCNEDSPIKPTCSYTESKINSDLYLLKQDQLKVAVVRVCELYGKVIVDSYLDCIINSVLYDKNITINEISNFIRPYADIRDCIHLINCISVNQSCGVHNISTTLYLHAIELLDMILEVFDYDVKKVNYTYLKAVNIPSIKVEYLKTTEKFKHYIDVDKNRFIFFLHNVAHFKRLLLQEPSLIL